MDSTRLFPSPNPNNLEMKLSAWNGSNASKCSPLPKKMIGAPVAATCRQRTYIYTHKKSEETTQKCGENRHGIRGKKDRRKDKGSKKHEEQKHGALSTK
jgi:hypothetical protein